MAVLVEAISVIVRADRLLEAFDGDWATFKALVPNDKLCADGELARVGFGNKHGLNCVRNEANYAGHIWDRRDAAGHMGATACIVVPAFRDAFQAEGDWQKLA